MKTNILLYISGLILLAGAIFLLIEHPASNRFSMIAGYMTLFGIVLNLAGFFLKNSPSKV